MDKLAIDRRRACIRKVRTVALAVIHTGGARRMEPARRAAAVANVRAGCSRERQLGEPGDMPSGDLALRQLIARNRPPAWRVPRSTVTIDPECQEGINGSSLAAPLVRLSQRWPQCPRRTPGDLRGKRGCDRSGSHCRVEGCDRSSISVSPDAWRTDRGRLESPGRRSGWSLAAACQPGTGNRTGLDQLIGHVAQLCVGPL